MSEQHNYAWLINQSKNFMVGIGYAEKHSVFMQEKITALELKLSQSIEREAKLSKLMWLFSENKIRVEEISVLAKQCLKEITEQKESK